MGAKQRKAGARIRRGAGLVGAGSDVEVRGGRGVAPCQCDPTEKILAQRKATRREPTGDRGGEGRGAKGACSAWCSILGFQLFIASR